MTEEQTESEEKRVKRWEARRGTAAVRLLPSPFLCTKLLVKSLLSSSTLSIDVEDSSNTLASCSKAASTTHSL